MIEIGPIKLPKRTVAGGMIIAATLALAFTESIGGDLALFTILGVGSALGVYEGVRMANETDSGNGEGGDQ